MTLLLRSEGTWRYVITAVLALGACRAQAHHPEQDYVLFCMGCHGPQAQGIPGRIPPLAHRIARFMQAQAPRVYLLQVPGVSGSALTDEQIAGVLNWLAEHFDREHLTAEVSLFTTEEVARWRHIPLADVSATRRRVLAEIPGQLRCTAAEWCVSQEDAHAPQ